MIRISGLRLCTIAAIVSVLPCASNAQSVLTHHVREVTLSGAKQLPSTASPPLKLSASTLVLPLRDPEGLKSFLADLYDPNSPHLSPLPHSPPRFTARFGPTEEQYAEVLRFAKTNGLTCHRRLPRRHGSPGPRLRPRHRARHAPQPAHPTSTPPKTAPSSPPTANPTHGPLLQPLARIRPRQLLQPTPALREEVRLRQGPRH